MRCTRSGRPASSSGALAARRSSSDDAVGPAPTMRQLERPFCTVVRAVAERASAGQRRRAARPAAAGQAEVVAQRRALVVGAEHAALLEQRDDLVDEAVEAVRREVGHEDVAVGGVGLHVAVDRLGDRRRTADERRAGGHLDDELADAQALALGERPPLGGDGERVGLVADPAAGDRRCCRRRRGRCRAAGRRGRSRTGRGPTPARRRRSRPAG